MKQSSGNGERLDQLDYPSASPRAQTANAAANSCTTLRAVYSFLTKLSEAEFMQ